MYCRENLAHACDSLPFWIFFPWSCSWSLIRWSRCTEKESNWWRIVICNCSPPNKFFFKKRKRKNATNAKIYLVTNNVVFCFFLVTNNVVFCWLCHKHYFWWRTMSFSVFPSFSVDLSASALSGLKMMQINRATGERCNLASGFMMQTVTSKVIATPRGNAGSLISKFLFIT